MSHPTGFANVSGAVVSSVIVVVNAFDQFPTPSLNFTYTVFTPSPVPRVHVFVAA